MKPVNTEDKMALRLQNLGINPSTIHRNTEKSVITLEKYDVDFSNFDSNEMIGIAKKIDGLNVLERFIRFVLVKFSESKVFSKCCGQWANKKLAQFAKKQLIKEFCQYTSFFKISNTAHLAQKKTTKGEISGFILQRQIDEVAREIPAKDSKASDFIQEFTTNPKAPKLTFSAVVPKIEYPLDHKQTKRAPKKAPVFEIPAAPKQRLRHSSRSNLGIV